MQTFRKLPIPGAEQENHDVGYHACPTSEAQLRLIKTLVHPYMKYRLIRYTARNKTVRRHAHCPFTNARRTAYNKRSLLARGVGRPQSVNCIYPKWSETHMPTAAKTTKSNKAPLPEPVLPPRKRRPEALTTREQEILELIWTGFKNRNRPAVKNQREDGRGPSAPI